MILELSFVLLTPIEQLWPSLASCPTKSSLRKFMLSLGFMWTPFSTMCMNVWNLKTMLNSSRPFDKAHLLRLSYDRKNLWARFILLSNSWGLRNLPPSSYRSIKGHKLSKASSIWHSSTLVLSTISLRIGRNALQKCFVSAPLASNFGKFWCGFFGSTTIPNFKLVSLVGALFLL